MNKIFKILAVLVVFIFLGCADKKYSANDVGSMGNTYTGVISNIEYVKLEGDGTGGMLGHLVGILVGYQFGDGAGKMFATYAGSVVGGIAGQKADYTNGLKIAIKLDGSGNNVTTILKKDNKNSLYKIGDRVSMLVSNNKIIDISLTTTPNLNTIKKEENLTIFDSNLTNQVK